MPTPCPPLVRARRSISALALGLAVTLTAAACGGDEHGGHGAETSAELSTTEHNDADVAFATDMIQHHAQALSMVDLTRGRPLDPEVQRLAERIRDAQAPEIETMSDWLTDWDEEVPATMRDHAHAGHEAGDVSESMEDMDHGDMPGMMTAEDMDALENASDTEFQTLWLEMMVEHHTGAVEMARTEQEDGRFEPAVELAEAVVASQTAEIEEMESLLGS